MGDWTKENKSEWHLMKAIYPLISLLVALLRTDAQGGTGIPLSDDFWLIGDFTQNVPCKGDGSDVPESKVKVATDHIDSKAGVCRFINARLYPRSRRRRVPACCRHGRCSSFGCTLRCPREAGSGGVRSSPAFRPTGA